MTTSSEEFYNAKNKSEIAYAYTLLAYLNHPQLNIFEDLLDRYTDEERYEECDGVNKALQFIENTYSSRFADAAEKTEDEHFVVTEENYGIVNNIIFQDILDEFIKQQIKGHQVPSGKKVRKTNRNKE